MNKTGKKSGKIEKGVVKPPAPKKPKIETAGVVKPPIPPKPKNKSKK